MNNKKLSLHIIKYAKKYDINAIEVGIFKDNKVDFFSSNGEKGRAFQIGSITKIYTAFAIMIAIEEKLINRESNLKAVFGNSFDLNPAIGSITINELLTHSSGIPRIPESLLEIMGVDSDDPYRQLNHEHIYEYLKNPGVLGDKKALYSNLGYGLLGIVLEHLYKLPLHVIFKLKIFEPLRMNDTSLNIDNNTQHLIVQGYNRKNEPTTLWYNEALAGAGSIISTTNDHLKFLAAHFENNKLGNILLTMTDLQTKGMATGWLRFGRIFRILGAGSTLFHNGGTGGFHSYTTINVKKKVGMILLINKVGDFDQLGMDIMDKL